MLTAKDVFDQIRSVAIKSTDEDERPLQIDYSALETKINLAIGERKIAHLYINAGIPHGDEDQERFNALGSPEGMYCLIWLLEMIISGTTYFLFTTWKKHKFSMVCGKTKAEEVRVVISKAQEKPFVSLTLMHGEKSHLLVALDDPQREKALLELVSALTASRHPE